MALKLNITTTRLGVALPEAYVRIVDFSGDKKGVTFSFDIYASKEARDAGADAVQRGRFATEGIPEGALIPALYAALKADPAFAGAVDC